MGCSGFPVYVIATGKVVGCHPTKTKAAAQLAALNINAKGAARMPNRQREYRQVAADYTLDEGTPGRIVADVVTYNVVDSYGTMFDPGAFTESLQNRMPTICWGHSWLDPIGQWVDYDNNEQRLRLMGELDLETRGDQLLVPSAHRAYLQLKKRTITDFSVGFLRLEDRKDAKNPSVYVISKGLLDEASPVMIGSVPGAELVSIRSTRTRSALTRSGNALLVPADLAQDIIVRFERGDLDLGDAIQELKRVSVTADELGDDANSDDDDDTSDDDTSEGVPDEEPVPELPDDLDAVLEELGIEVDLV